MRRVSNPPDSHMLGMFLQHTTHYGHVATISSPVSTLALSVNIEPLNQPATYIPFCGISILAKNVRTSIVLTKLRQENHSN